MDFILTGEFERRAELLMNTFHTPGLSVSTTTAKKTVSKGFGYARTEDSRRVTPQTIFDSSSASKCLTAAAAATLVAKGSLEWTTPVRGVLPAFSLKNGVEVTMQDLLSHNTGIPNHEHCLMGEGARKPDTPTSVAAKVCHLTPGLRRDTYSNPMYTTASFLIEAVSGERFASYLTSNVLRPLGMNSTYVQPSAVPRAVRRERLARPHMYTPGESAGYAGVHAPDMPERQGAGMVQTSTEDYAKWLRANLARDPALFERRPEMYATLMEPRTKNTMAGQRPHSEGDAWSLGWNVREYRGRRIVYQDGPTGRAMLLPDVEEPFGIVIFGNSDGAEDVAEVLCMELIDRALSVPPSTLCHWLSLQKAVVKARGVDGYSLQEVEEQARTSCLEHWTDPDDAADDNNSNNDDQTTPFPLEAYAGRYRSKGYGDIWVSITNGLSVVSPPAEAEAEAEAETETASTPPAAGDGAVASATAATQQRPAQVQRLAVNAMDRSEPFQLTIEPCGHCNCDAHEGTMTKFVAVRMQGRTKVDCIRVEASTEYDPTTGQVTRLPRSEVSDPRWRYEPTIKRIGLALEREIGFPGLIWFQRGSSLDLGSIDSDDDDDDDDDDEDDDEDDEDTESSEDESPPHTLLPPEYRLPRYESGERLIPGIS